MSTKFEKGNQLWKLRNKHGRDALFKSPELLWQSACEYFEWCNDNPIIVTKSSSGSNGSSNEVKEYQRPFTKQGLFIFVGCSDTWLTNFKKSCNSDFLRVIEAIEQTIENQQIEHAMVGVFNSNLVARINGIKEQTENVNHNTNVINLGTGKNPSDEIID